MLINFTLVPVERVEPWGSPGNLSLSWFGLTEGEFWIQAGASALFEYSDEVRGPGEPHYCAYQVVRLYEDLMDMLPHILEPVPTPLVQYLAGDTGLAWEAFRSWFVKDIEYPDEAAWDLMSAASRWIGDRTLDSAYLCPTANIVIWSDEVNVSIEWDNRTKLVNGKPAWTALRGRYQLPRAEFMAEIESFHSRLMAQMASRVDQVLSGAFARDINIDLPYLVREQEERRYTLDRVLSSSPQTDWQAVERATNEILNAQKGIPH